ncbi:MAG: glycerol-3-phosphate dehydrogenase, partial [Kiritimatiellia bacterium]
MRVAVLGDGGWGTALALTLVRNGHSPTVWGPNAEYLDTV